MSYQDIISLALQGMCKEDKILQVDVKEITGILRERMKTAKARDTDRLFKELGELPKNKIKFTGIKQSKDLCSCDKCMDERANIDASDGAEYELAQSIENYINR